MYSDDHLLVVRSPSPPFRDNTACEIKEGKVRSLKRPPNNDGAAPGPREAIKKRGLINMSVKEKEAWLEKARMHMCIERLCIFMCIFVRRA